MVTSPDGRHYILDPMLDLTLDNYPAAESTDNNKSKFKCIEGKPCPIYIARFPLGGQKCAADYYEMAEQDERAGGSGRLTPEPVHFTCPNIDKSMSVEALSETKIERSCDFQPNNTASQENTGVQSFDPNDKVGSKGANAGQYVSEQEPLRYLISFENLDTATAPAQEVVITDHLNPNLMDLSTLSLGPISFGDKIISPPSGQSNFATDVDLRPENNLLVRIKANFEVATNILTWRLTSIDPATGKLTTDPLAGFLPPNTDEKAPQGSGGVLLTVMPKRDLTTGTEIQNSAQIIFDTNEPIDTPVWFNTIDNSLPESNVVLLPETQTTTQFELSWTGSDEGAGIKDYTVYVSEDEGPYTPWITNTTDTTKTFTGKFGKSYRFYSIARDGVGNTEETPDFPDAVTTISNVDTIPPALSCPSDITGEVGLTVNLGSPTVSDNVDPNPTVTNNAPANYPPGLTTVTWTATDNSGNVSTCLQNVTLTYQFAGFFKPIDNQPVQNMVKAGSAVPVKFSLSGDHGLAIFASGYPKSQAVSCDPNSFTLVNELEETATAGASALSYDADKDQYSYIWKTDPSWKGACRQLIVKLNDTMEKRADFIFK